MDEFWTNIEDIASVPGESVLELGQIIDLFLDVVSENWDFLVDDEPLVCARLLLNAKSITRHPKLTRQRLLGCIPNAINKSPQWACFLATVLGIDDRVLELMANSHVQQLVDVVWMYRYTEIRCITLYMQLLFVVVMRCEFEMLIFNEAFCSMLLENLCESEASDPLGLAALKLLAAINHKYTIAGLENCVMGALARDVQKYHRLGECTIWHFNRHRSSTSQLLTCKLIYQILSQEIDILYFNDLKVLIDILLRELADGTDAERLQELYLLVLLKVLQTNALYQEPYKRSALVRVLRLCLENTTNHNIINLTNDCLRIPWLGWFNTVHVSPHASRDDLVLATKVESIGGGPIESPFGDAFVDDFEDTAPAPRPEVPKFGQLKPVAPEPRAVTPVAPKSRGSIPTPPPPRERIRPPPPPPRGR